MYTVLVVGNNRQTGREITGLIAGGGYNLLEAEALSAVVSTLRTYPVDVLVVVLEQLEDHPLALLTGIHQQYPTIETILLTRLPSLEAVNLTIKNPHLTVLNHPYEGKELLELLNRAVARVRSQEDVLKELDQLSDEKQLLVDSLKEKQQSHSQLESEFRCFTDHTGDLYLRLDRDRNLVYANPASRTLLGISDNESPSQSLLFDEIVHPEDRQMLTELVERVYRRESDYENCSLRLRTPDQSTHWVRLSLTAMLVEDLFHGISCIMHDRTDSYIAQFNLKQSNRNLRVLQQFDKLLDMHLDSDDLETQVMTALVREFNLKAALMFAPHTRGLQLVAVGGRSAGLEPDALQPVDRKLERILNSGNPVQVASWKAEDYAGDLWEPIGQGETLQIGFLHCALGEGLRRYILLLGTDRDFATVSNLFLLRQIVTSLARSIANNLMFRVVREAKADWEATFDSIPDMIAVVDREGRILLSNEALAKFCSREVDELEGVSLSGLFFSQDDPRSLRIQELIDRARPGSLASSDTPPDRELKFRVVPNIYSSKAISIVVVQDVTEEQQMEQRNRELEAKLFQEARLSSIGLLASGIAHNLNGPLMTIMGSVDLALHQDPDNKAMQRISRQVGVMKDIIGNLMTKSRREQETGVTELDLNRLLQDQLEFLQADMRFKHMMQKRIELDPSFPRIMGVYADFSQVVNAILNNSIEAMLETERKELLVRTYREGEEAILEISDSGSGMDEATRDRMFDPFFSTKQALDPGTTEYKGGTGLGMTTVYNILKNYQILLQVKSTPGSGSSFFLHFPPTLQITGQVANQKELDHE